MPANLFTEVAAPSHLIQILLLVGQISDGTFPCGHRPECSFPTIKLFLTILQHTPGEQKLVLNEQSLNPLLSTSLTTS